VIAVERAIGEMRILSMILINADKSLVMVMRDDGMHHYGDDGETEE